MLNTAQTIRLVNVLTEYDAAESRKQTYNPYALGQYLRSTEQLKKFLANGMDRREAIARCFNGVLEQKVCKVMGVKYER